MLEAAVLIEAGWQDFVDEVWVMVVNEETAIARTMARDGLDREAVKGRIEAQLSNDERKRHADVVIDNSGNEEELQQQLKNEFAKLAQRRAA